MKLIGSYIDDDANDTLLLYCVANKISKSLLLRKIISDFLGKFPVDIQLLENITVNIQDNWKQMRAYQFFNLEKEELQKQFLSYKIKQSSLLVSKGLPISTVSKIISQLKK